MRSMSSVAAVRKSRLTWLQATTALTGAALGIAALGSPAFAGGALPAGGQVVSGQSLCALSNPAGIVFLNGSTVNVGSLIATTAKMNSQDIATYGAGGRLSFSVPGQDNATVANQGTLTVAQAGIAALVAPGVRSEEHTS